jgi:hypothetical protein
MRNGAVQYSLLSPELQKATLAQFEEVHWVPGVSSPWTEKYTVTPLTSDNRNEASFSIEFQLAASTGDAGSGKGKITVGTGRQLADYEYRNRGGRLAARLDIAGLHFKIRTGERQMN